MSKNFYLQGEQIKEGVHSYIFNACKKADMNIDLMILLAHSIFRKNDLSKVKQIRFLNDIL